MIHVLIMTPITINPINIGNVNGGINDNPSWKRSKLIDVRLM